MTYIRTKCGGAQPKRKKAFGSKKWQCKKKKQKHEKRSKRIVNEQIVNVEEELQQYLPVSIVENRYVC